MRSVLMILSLAVAASWFAGCGHSASGPESPEGSRFQSPESSRFQSPAAILEFIRNPADDYILVTVHRGDWRNAPENSIQAVHNCIEMGAEIVEIDVRMTRDSGLIIMHDLTLDRTSTGHGRIADRTMKEISHLHLRNGADIPTHHRVPSLKEMLLFVKGKPVLLNLDKSWDYLPQAYQVLKETGTVDQAIFKSSTPLPLMRARWGAYIDSVHYMPMVGGSAWTLRDGDTIASPLEHTKDFLEGFQPLAFEAKYRSEDSPVFEAISLMREKGYSVWVSTLWASLCAGHHDDMALEDPEEHYGFVIETGANIIQTDRPAFLMQYLESKGLR